MNIKHSLEKKLANKQWFSFSVLADKSQYKIQQIDEYVKIGALCTDIPIPVIENNSLPDETIFPISHDFR